MVLLVLTSGNQLGTEYPVLGSIIASDAQGNLTQNPERVTHNSNRIIEQKLFIYLKIPVLPPPKNLGIDQGIAPILLAPQTLLNPVTNKVFAYLNSGSASIHRTPQQLIRTGINGSTPGDIFNDIHR